MRWLGGLPVSRKHPQGQVAQVAAALRAADEMVLVLAPEGTRSWRPGWRTGFYHMAQQGGVPLQLGYLDYAHKVIGFGPSLEPTGDLSQDFALMRAFYQRSGCHGRFPELASPVQPMPSAPPS